MGGLTPKALNRIFPKWVFLNLLDLIQLPRVVSTLFQTEILTSIRLGCDILQTHHHDCAKAVDLPPNQKLQ